VASVVLSGMLLLADLWPTTPMRDLLRATIANAGAYALFGFVLGFAGLVPRAAGTPRLIVTGLAMVVLLSLTRIAISAATHRAPEPGVSGVVLAPNGAPAAGAPVFLDRGSGGVERLTTDRAGLFVAARGLVAPRQVLALICVPGAVPFVARADEYLRTPRRYQVMALPPRAIIEPGIRAFGWQQPIPRECLGGSPEQW
jgi:hypothetical protein